MTRGKTAEEWQTLVMETIAQARGWSMAHPHATWAELEQAVEAALAPLRRDLLEAGVQDHPLADFRGAAERPSCPACGCRLQAGGQMERTLLTRQNQPVRLKRTRARCPECGTGFFPPG